MKCHKIQFKLDCVERLYSMSCQQNTYMVWLVEGQTERQLITHSSPDEPVLHLQIIVSHITHLYHL